MRARDALAGAAGSIKIGGELEVNRLGYGAMRITGPGVWGRPEDPDAARALLRRAVELGVNLIDTADSYGPEVSEQLIAEALHPYGDGLLIATKGGLVRTGPHEMAPDGRPEHLRRACEGSLRRLRLECIDLYQLHAPDRRIPYEESVGALAELRGEGKIRHIGVSNVSVDLLDRARGVVEIAAVQNRYNIADRRFDDVLEASERGDLAFLPWAPLDTGATTRRGGPLGQVATSRDVSRSQVALAWLLHRSPAMLPIPGTASAEHLDGNVAAAAVRLSDEEMARLAAVRPAWRTVKRRLKARAAEAARRVGYTRSR
jgi:pyridoxine 4-dehydrogenase